MSGSLFFAFGVYASLLRWPCENGGISLGIYKATMLTLGGEAEKWLSANSAVWRWIA